MKPDTDLTGVAHAAWPAPVLATTPDVPIGGGATWLAPGMDEIAEWGHSYDRVVALVGALDEAQAATAVPACPDWTVHELLSHMIGLDADVVAGDEPDDHNSEWTKRQVDARVAVGVADLLAEWRSLVDPVQGWMRAHGTRPLGDIVVHEQDLRGALHVSGGQDTGGLQAVRDRMLARFAHRVTSLPAIALVGPTWQWCSRGDVHDAAVVLQAGDFDLARALMTRRSAAQLRAWTVRGDVAPYLAAFAGLGPLPETDLTE